MNLVIFARRSSTSPCITLHAAHHVRHAAHQVWLTTLSSTNNFCPKPSICNGRLPLWVNRRQPANFSQVAFKRQPRSARESQWSVTSQSTAAKALKKGGPNLFACETEIQPSPWLWNIVYKSNNNLSLLLEMFPNLQPAVCSVPLQVVLRVHNACQLPLASCNHAEGICARRCADWNDLKHTPNNEHANQIRKGAEETHRQGFHGSEHHSVKVTKAHGISHQSVGCDMHLFTRVLRL